MRLILTGRICASKGSGSPGAVQRSGKSSEKGKEAGIDDGGLRNEMYEKFFEQLLLLRTDLFEASESAICARALPTARRLAL